LHGGQEAIIRSNAVNQASSIVHIGAIPDERKQFLSDRTAMACIAKRTVYFEVIDRKNERGRHDQEIQAAEVVPTNKPTNFTISPSSCRSNAETRSRASMQVAPFYRTSLIVLIVGGIVPVPARALLTFDQGHDQVFVTGSLSVAYDTNIAAK